MAKSITLDFSDPQWESIQATFPDGAGEPTLVQYIEEILRGRVVQQGQEEAARVARINKDTSLRAAGF
jgi:hypothetical protein